MTPSPEEGLLPGIVWSIDIKGGWSTIFEIFSVCDRTRAMIVKIMRIVGWAEIDHIDMVAESEM